MRSLLAFMLLLSLQPIYAQDSAIVTGLVEPCQEELDKYLAPGAVFSPKMINPPKSCYLNQYIPVIGDQGAQGACTAFSVSAAITILENQRMKRIYNDPNTQDYTHWYSPAYIFNIGKSKYPISRSENCADGISYIDAFNVVREYGVAPYPFAIYNPSGNAGCQSKYYPDAKALKEGQKRKIATFQRVEKDLLQFKSLLADQPGYPICISVYIDKGYKAASEGKNNSIWAKAETAIPGQVNNRHAMVIVGYSDSINCFKVLDSKGYFRGDNGFLWLHYNLLATGVIYDAYVCSLDDRLLRAQRNSGEEEQELAEGASAGSWAKEGYFRGFNGFRIGCLKIDKPNRRVTYRISNHYTGEILIPEITIVENSSKLFSLRGKTFSLFQKDITHSHGNPLKLASEFEITFKGENAVQQYVTKSITQNNFKTLATMTFISKRLKKQIENMVYTGPSDAISIGSVISSGSLLVTPSAAFLGSDVMEGSDANTAFPTNTNTELFSFYYLLENLNIKMDDSLRIFLENNDSLKLKNWRWRIDNLSTSHLIQRLREPLDTSIKWNLEDIAFHHYFLQKQYKPDDQIVTGRIVLRNLTGSCIIKSRIDQNIRTRLLSGIQMQVPNAGTVKISLSQDNELTISFDGTLNSFVKMEKLGKVD